MRSRSWLRRGDEEGKERHRLVRPSHGNDATGVLDHPKSAFSRGRGDTTSSTALAIQQLIIHPLHGAWRTRVVTASGGETRWL